MWFKKIRIVHTFCLLLWYCVVSSCASSQDTCYTKKLRLQQTSINLFTCCYKDCNQAISYISLHDNENTAVQAADSLLQLTGGKITQLIHNGERIIRFQFRKEWYAFDPNRIFTPEGRKLTLQKFGNYNLDAAKILLVFANQITAAAVDGKELVIALHNNTDSAYSINSYTQANEEAGNADSVFINTGLDPDDFILTTDTAVFAALRDRQLNVVLQHNSQVADDGSLSVYAAKKGISYINVEAEENHLAEQYCMLASLLDVMANMRKR